MSIMKMTSSGIRPLKYMREHIEYLTAPSKFYGAEKPLIGTSNCITHDPSKVFEEMCMVKKLLHKSSGRQYIECIISPGSDDEYHTDDDFLALAKEISDTLFAEFQTLYVVHKDSEYRHIHICVNSVSPFKNRKYCCSRGDLCKMKQKANDILMKHGFSICKMSFGIDKSDAIQNTN